MTSESDLRIQREVEAALRDDPRLHAARIGVAVEAGAVVMLGAVDTLGEKDASEEATRRVRGVRTVAQDLEVRLRTEHERSDPELAAAIQQALARSVFSPQTVTARVEHGVVTLAGEVEWNFQREAADYLVRHMTGVSVLHNRITLNPRASTADVRAHIEAALARQVTADLRSLRVETSGGTVTLTGHASSRQAIEDAVAAAWRAPGVTEVIDRAALS